MDDYRVNIIGLSQKQHSFTFQMEDAFFNSYGAEVVSKGNFNAKVLLDKRETLIEADFEISGKAELVCDRSLDPFEYPMNIHRKMLFKYGEVPEEVSDEITIITSDQVSLDVGQLMYEFIVLDIPIKKIHPRFQTEEAEENEEGTMVYRSEKDEDQIDPRWEQLKKLKK